MSEEIRPLKLANYPELLTPEAWKPIFRAMEHFGWELASGPLTTDGWESRLMLRFERGTQACFLVFWEEAEWCGNNYQSNSLTVVGLHPEAPSNLAEAERHAIVLTGYWEWELEDFMTDYKS